MGFLSDFGGALISGGSSLIGGYMGKKSAQSTNRHNAEQNRISNLNNRRASALDRKSQKEFAKMGVRWKVADAKAAGLHPLAALGISTSSATPVSIGSTPHQEQSDNSMGNALSNMGQDISRAVTAKQTAEERAPYNALVQQNLQLQNQKLIAETSAISSGIRNQSQMPPPMPYGGTSSVFPVNVEELPSEVRPREANNPSIQAGNISSTQYMRQKNHLMPVQSKYGKERLEEDLIGSVVWNAQNRGFEPMSKPTMTQIHRHWPSATGVKWSYIHQGWAPTFKTGSVSTPRNVSKLPRY